MSREQWGHGYWKGVSDAQNGAVKGNIKDEAMYWIANMCVSNKRKTLDASLYPVKEWLSMCRFCGLSERYAKRIYDYVYTHNHFEFEPQRHSLCYITGDERNSWTEDYFCLPIGNYETAEWAAIKDKLFGKIKEGE